MAANRNLYLTSSYLSSLSPTSNQLTYPSLPNFSESPLQTLPHHNQYSNDIATTSSSSSSSSHPPWAVFLNFYGKDTRENFIKALYCALVEAGVRTFRDDISLKMGDDVSAGLHIAIRNSQKSVVVLSENYARSAWCLDELVQILKRRGSGHQVFPVFYHVEPSIVRYQKGSFGEALESHKKYYHVNLIEIWSSALYAISLIKGYHLKKDSYISDLDAGLEIAEIVAQQASPNVIEIDKCLFGIDSVVENMIKKISIESYDVRALAICGMGGMGKTTAAKAFYNKNINKFDISCFIRDARQILRGDGSLLPLLNQLLIMLLKRKDYKVCDLESGQRELKKFLSFKKALIVFDDLDRSTYSILLPMLGNLVSSGSRIIITTREAAPLKQLKVNIPVDVYRVKRLGEIESLELFSYHAFRKPRPAESFRELSKSFVTYAGGHPLALTVMGSSLRGRSDLDFWKAKLLKLQHIADPDIRYILEQSYDDLDDETLKKTFLDIVFYFIGKDKDDAVHVLQSCGYYPEVGIPILEENGFLTIDKNNKFQMHNLLQRMGREVGHEQGTHLYLGQEDAGEALHYLEETDTIEVLILDLTKSTRTQTSAKIFEKFPNLRLLEIIGAHEILESFGNSFHNLRGIRWHHCPWKHLPSRFRPQKLVFLEMPFSKFRTLWKSKKPLASLKIIDVSHSEHLTTTPDFTDCKEVVKLLLCGCKTLSKVHASIAQLTGLVHLDLGECVELKRLPESVKQLSNLGSLDMGGCSSMDRLPDQLGEMEGLKRIDVSCTAINLLPDSITCLDKLEELNLSGCKNIRKLPEQFGKIESLRIFEASCSAIDELPYSFGDLINLVELDLKHCKNLKSYPPSMNKLKLFEYAMLSQIEALA